ncbi:MAG: hypothetical protein ONB30_03390 [candidate division KSB1 bacterium]|nr:hypothetical protein [candidate division KSB1 bacterium]
MVDINLLGEEEAPESGRSGGDYEPYRFEEPGGDTAGSSPQWTETSEGQHEFEEIEKRRPRAPWVLLFLIVAVTAAVIFLVWRPFGRRPAPVPPPAEVPDTTLARPSSELAAVTLPQRIENLLTSLPQEATFRSFSYTSGMFYLELEGGAPAEVQGFADGLKGTVAERTTVRQRGARALVVGSIEAPEGSGQLFGLKPLSSEALGQLVRATADSVGLRLIRLAQEQRTKLDETYHTPFQLMLEGPLAAAQEFLHQLNDAGVALQVTKLVITPLAPGQKEKAVRMVVHFDLLESS